LAVKYEDDPSLPQSPPLIAEIASPNDSAEDLFAKANEYLASQCQEVWLVFPESKRVLIILPEKTLAFSHNDSVSTQAVLTGFTISVKDLFS
jgi:Uma2 family endonuclease